MQTPDSKLPTDNKTRCRWCGSDPLYMEYHDKEWGKTVHDDDIFFEFLTLEAAQAGLSWITILRRRNNYRKAFADFDVKKVARFDEADKERLLYDEGIIRNRLKISSAIRNAELFMDVQKEFGSFDQYLYSFMPGGQPITEYTGAHVSTPESDALSKDMKKRGFKFVGTTICYAFMQATGMVNDHVPNCSFR